MISPLDLKKLQVELLRVGAAKGEMELRIQERMEEIERLKEQISIQDKRINELNQKLQENK